MNKIVIAIVPQVKHHENPYQDSCTYVNLYSKKIIENGAIPLGLISVDGSLNVKALEACDGFLFPGGIRIERFHFQILDFAIQNNKPLLGICLGMQVMAVYGYLYSELKRRKIKYTEEKLFHLYNQMKQEKVEFLKKIEIPNVHGYKIMNQKIEINIKNLKKQRHMINIENKSNLFKIYGCSSLEVISLHSYSVARYGDELFKPVAYSNDHIIEALELKDKDHFIIC